MSLTRIVYVDPKPPKWGSKMQCPKFKQQSAISSKRYEIGCQLLLITNRKLHTVFRLVPTSVTLHDLDRCNSIFLLYFTEFDSFAGLLASCLINAQPLLAHRPAADDNEMGCCQVVVWVRSFIKPDLFDNNVPLDNTTPIYLIRLKAHSHQARLRPSTSDTKVHFEAKTVLTQFIHKAMIFAKLPSLPNCHKSILPAAVVQFFDEYENMRKLEVRQHRCHYQTPFLSNGAI